MVFKVLFKTLFNVKSNHNIFYLLIIFSILQALHYLLIVKPLNLEKLNLTLKNNELKEQMAIKYQKLESLTDYKGELFQIRNSLNKELKGKKNFFNFSELLDEIYKSGLEEGVVFEFLQPSSIINKTFYDRRKIKMRLHGQYANLIHFFNKIHGLNYFLVVDEFSFKQVNKITQLRLDLTLSCYQFSNISINEPSLPKPSDRYLNKDILFKALTLPTFNMKNPFQYFPKIKVRLKLAEYNLSEIKLFGLINKENKIWAIVGNNEQNLIHIQVGDYISKDRAKFNTHNKNAIQLILKSDDNRLLNKKIVQLKFAGS